ncbi:hypothetical protein PAHAL_2G090600 [Panicum hallii]|uniref:Agenet domain-containing protein n=1 Tax=Panicum hallii TaxID=206008 RepID=A0A2S3GX59_9POAL|nr:uncharacterized protein LOC112879778 [Panicum hallii]PAN10382.1 hypothetical protein PAHAL_2G090600 [Panicum hallii]
MPAGRSPALSGRRRSRKKGQPTPSPPPPAQEPNPLPPGTEVEVRIDDEGFYGSWYEATVVGFDPAAGRGSPAKYTVTYSHLEAQDGPDSVAPSHVRPRPPPPPGPGSPPSTPSPPRFLLHDFVEAFDCEGWWSGIVFAPAPADPGSPVTVAFPITREVLLFPAHLVRPRRDYVGGEWAPSRAVISVQPRRAVRVYKAGEKVELLREREAYGDSWFPATVAKAVDRLSYIVEYLDDQVGGGKAAVYRHSAYIRPAKYHRPRESKVVLCPGTAVEVYCDGAWSQGVVRRVVREGCEYEVSIDGEEAEQLLTKAVYQLRPLYMWNGKHWTNPGDKGQANLRQQSASGKRPSSPVDGTSSDDKHSSVPESPTVKKSRKEPQQQDLLLDEGSEHAPVSEMDASLCASCKSLASDRCPNSCLLLSEKNGLSVFPHKAMTTCSVSKNGILCASSGHSEPPEASNHSPSPCPLLSEKNGLSVLPHEIVSTCSVSKDGLLCASSGHSAPPEASDHFPNLCPPLSGKNGLSVLPHKIVSTSSVSKNGLHCASTGHTAPPVASNHPMDSCPLLSEKNRLSMLAHKIVSICSMSKNGLLCASSGNPAPPEESVPGLIGEIECSRDAISEVVPSNGQLNTPVCERNVDVACDMLSIPEVRKQNIASSLRDQLIQERTFFVKELSVKKGISKNKKGATHPKAQAHQGKIDASDHVQIQLKENKNSSGKEIICALSASAECQKTSAWTRQVSGGTSSGSDTEGVNFKKLARKEGSGLLDKELSATINRDCQVNRNADVCTDTAATQVTKSNPLTEIPILSLDHLVQQDGSKVDERSIVLPLQNARNSEFTTDHILLRTCSFSGSSMPSHLSSSPISGNQVPFVKSSPLWPLIDAWDVFKKVPQQPHFRPVTKFLPALREGMALGLMATFASSVEGISKSSIADSIASFEEKITTLRHLEENGFDVEFLRCGLVKLIQIKSDHTSYLTEKDQLKAQLLEKAACLSRFDERLDKKEQTIARLEEELGRARWEARKMFEEKEREDGELSRLNAADSSVEEACAGAELQFQSVLAELRRKSLT